MLCLEIAVNGVTRYVAGAAAAEHITTQVAVYPELRQSWISTTAEFIPEDQPAAEASWPAISLQIGDEIQVRLVEADAPTPGSLGRADPAVTSSDEIPFVCSFCGKGPSAVKQMLQSRHALICNECVESFYDDLDD